MMAARTERIEIRVSAAERSRDEAAASARGETLSEFVRRAARVEAERVLSERERIRVDDDAAERFLEALDRPSDHAERGLSRLVDEPSVIDGT